MTELKACPFCGTRAYKMIGRKGFTIITCENKNCVCFCARGFDTEKEAIEAWNRRASDEA